MSTSLTAASPRDLVNGPLDPAAHAELNDALARLRAGRGLIVRSADLMGGLFGRFTRFGAYRLGMSQPIGRKLSGLAGAALARAYDVAILGLPDPAVTGGSGAATGAFARGAVVVSGAACGFAGMAGFVPDATFTTLTIMREIARIARDEGEDLSTDDARRACLEVFALQSNGQVAGGDAESELGYFSARLMMHGRPVMLLISEVAARYGLNLSQKFAAQAVPFAGAVAGAALNSAFLAHYRNLARAHFIIRRLERTHGVDRVRAAAIRP